MVEFEEVLVPVDGSESAHRAAGFGVRLAEAVGMPLKLVHVVSLTPQLVMTLAKMSKDDIHALQQQQARAVLDQAQAAIAACDVRAAIGELVLVGDAAQEILGYLEAHPKTLVVMGRRGLSPIRSLMVGSVSEKVMRYALGAVTLVH